MQTEPMNHSPSRGPRHDARRSTLAVAFFLAALLAGCGGGGGTEDGGAPAPAPVPSPAPGPAPTPSPTPAPTPVNGDFAGTLYFADPSSTLVFDVATGRSTTLRVQDALLNPSADGTRFTWTSDEPADRYNEDRLVISGPDGLILSQFDVADGLRGSGELSPDGTRVIVNWSTDQDPSSYIPTVFDLQGHVLKRYPGYVDYAWLPDGRLLMTRGDSIYIVDADLGTPRVLRQFPKDAPDFLSPSPDGQRIAFVLGDEDLLQNHVFMMNVDGSGLRQVTTSSLNEDGAGWSPDGRFLALRQGIAYGALSGGIPGGGCPEVWIVPSDEPAVVNLAQSDPATKGRMLHARDPDGSIAATVCAFSVPRWRATAQALPSSNGTPFAGGGPNAGLGGRLWADDAFNNVLYDLATGEPVHSIEDDTSTTLFIGPSGTEFAAISSAPRSGDYTSQAILTESFDGTVSSYFELPEWASGYPKLSPDGTLIALDWNSDANDDPAAVGIVTLFTRDGHVVARAQGYGDWEWMPDGRLLLTSGAELDAIDAGHTTISKLTMFPESIQDIALSPDAAKLAFTMNSHVWTANVDGSGLKQLTASSGWESTPVWSPDGRAVAFRHIPEIDACPEVHAVPVDGERVLVNQAGSGSSDLRLTVDDARDGPRDLCAFSKIAWLR